MNSFKILSVTALLALFCGATSFAETLTVDAGGPVAAGTTGVPVNIIINEGQYTAGASFTVTYDPAKLVYRGVSSLFFATFAEQLITPSSVTVDSQLYTQGLVTNPSSGMVMLAAAQSSNGASGQQTLFTLSFDVLSGVTGTANIGITASTITNEAAGYPTATQLPLLVGISGTTYPTVPVTTITPDTLTISSGITDTDGDGIDDTWEITHFGNLTTANATSDFDQDGYTDKREYLNDYDPKVINPPLGPGFVSIAPDSLLINFSGLGLWAYNAAATFLQLSGAEPTSLATVDIDSDGVDEIVAYFPGYGTYIWDNGVWGNDPIAGASAVPEAMLRFGNSLAIDFGATFGLYTYNTSDGFTSLAGLNPGTMAAADIDSDGQMELAVYFPTYGIWVWNNGSWGSSAISGAGAPPESMMKFGNSLAIDYGNAFGLYTYNTAEGLISRAGLNPDAMTEVDIDSDGVMELAVYFTGWGTWVLDNGAFGSTPIAPAAAVPEAMVKFGNRLAFDFGSAFGLYTYSSGEGLINLAGLNPGTMMPADIDFDGVMELAVYFPSLGIYVWDNGAWGDTAITTAAPGTATSGDFVK